MAIAKEKKFHKSQFVGRKNKILREKKPLLLLDFDPFNIQQTTENL